MAMIKADDPSGPAVKIWKSISDFDSAFFRKHWKKAALALQTDRITRLDRMGRAALSACRGQHFEIIIVDENLMDIAAMRGRFLVNT